MSMLEEIAKEAVQNIGIRRKAKGKVASVQISLNRGAYRNLTTLRSATKLICGNEACSTSILVWRAFEVYLDFINKISNQGDEGEALLGENKILKRHLGSRA